MKLNIPERIALLNVLPSEGNIVTLRVIRELQTRLSFSEEEIEEYGINNTMLPDGRATIKWNPDKANETKDVKIGKAGMSAIVERLKRLSATNRLHISMLPIYEKFVESEK